MFSEYTIRSITHIARADFLQRLRSYYFLISVGVCVFVIYSFVPAVDAGYTIVSLGNYRGFYNAAWIGTMVSMCSPFFALIGFYITNNAVKRDRDTGVGQIIATTRVTRIQYLTGKLFSNFAVLLVMLLVITAMTIVMFMVRGETSHLEWGKLLLPLLIMTLPAMFIIAALALVFDALCGNARGLANILYFFVWIFLVSIGMVAPATDVFGVNTSAMQIKQAVAVLHPDWNGSFGTGIIITGAAGAGRVFTWEGMNWTLPVILLRIAWMGAAFGMVLLASLRFDRFDKTATVERQWRKPLFTKETAPLSPDNPVLPGIRYRDLPPAEARFSFFSLVKAELQLMLLGRRRYWMALTAGLFVATLVAPLGLACRFGLPLLWLLQILILSKLGCRELENRCDGYIFAAAFPLLRQLPATLSAAVLVLLSLATPVMLREVLSGNFYSFLAIDAAALFIPALAVASGIFSGGSKIFEVVFTIMVYGILNGTPFFDFTGTLPGSKESGLAGYMAAAALVLIIMAFIGRRRQVSCS